MKISEITHIIVDSQLEDELGHYDLQHHESSVIYKGDAHKYHSSGLCRTVWVSPDKSYVLKIPIVYDWDLERDDAIQAIRDGVFNYKVPLEILHNIFEAKAYQDAPKKYRKYLAKTELIDHGWLRQEYCEVYPIDYRHDLKELGITKDKRHVIFDYDPLLSDWVEPRKGFYYDWLPKFIKQYKQQ